MAKLYDYTVDGNELVNSPIEENEFLYDICSSFCGDEEYVEVSRLPTHKRYIITFYGIDCFYDFGADYYFFVELE